MLQDTLRDCLATLVLPPMEQDLVSANTVRTLQVSDDQVILEVVLGFPFEGVRHEYERLLQAAIEPAADGRRLALRLTAEIIPHRVQGELQAMPSVSNVIAVASGKGGVGKSTTAVNLALALRDEGARVGLLDADIFGPSQPIMLGIPEGTRPEVADQRWFLPLMAHGLQTMSMGYLVNETTAVVMRGPKASGALQQLVHNTRWDKLDYLIVDMPPGTGDMQLTLAQQVPVAGAVIVTTPQDIALLDARKGIEMFRKVGIGVLGIVENMAMHICSNCGHAEHIFGQGGGERIADQYQTALLGSLPLSLAIRAQADAGAPTVVAAPDGPEAGLYREAARRVGARLAMQAPGERAFPKVVMEP